MWVRGHSRSFKLVPFQSSGAVFYSPSTVTMKLSCIVCEIATYWSKIVKLLINTPVFSAPAEGDPVGILQSCLIPIKLE